MTGGTKTVTLGEVLTFHNGRAFKKSDWKSDGLPIIRIQNLNAPEKPYNHFQGEPEDRHCVEAGDLLYAWSASLGPHIWAGESAVLNQHIFRVDPSERIDRTYAFHLLGHITDDLAKGSNGAIYGHLTKGMLLDHEVPLPPLAEQKRIVAVLDEAFAAIDAAAMNARHQAANVDEVVQARTRTLLVSSRCGKTVDLGDVIRLRRGFDITKKHQRPGAVPIVSSGGVSSTHDEAMAKGPGVVVGRKGSIGTVYYVESDFWPHDTTLFVDDFLGNHPRYAFHLLRSLDLKSLDSGAANPSLNRNLVHPLPVARLEPVEQERLVSEIDLLQATAENLLAIAEEKLGALNELRRSLLHRAFTGRLTAEGGAT